MNNWLKRCRVVLSSVLIVFLLSVPIFADVNIKDDTIYTQGFDVSDLLENVLDALEEVPNLEYLNYTFNIKYTNGSYDKEYVSKLQSQVIERMDGIMTVTPEIRLYLRADTITLKIRKYDIVDETYLNIMDSLVQEAKNKSSDVEKIWVLGNYFFNNHFVYAYDHEEEFPNTGSSNIFTDKNAMPDGVLSRKKGICMGYSNLMTDFCEKVGIPVIKIRGYDAVTNGYHAWNFCYLNVNGVYDWYSVEPQRGLHRFNHPKAVETLKVCDNEMNWDIQLQNDIIDLKYGINEIIRYTCGYCFSDISNHWASEYISELYSKNIVSGYTDGSFRPNNNITIAEFIQLCINAFVDKEDRPNENTWWDGAYNYALEKNIINSDLFPTDRVMDKITREEMAFIIQNLDKYLREKEDIEVSEDFIVVDEESISEVFRENVYQCYMKGYIAGVDDIGTFNPKGLATRGQCAVILYRLLEFGNEENIDTTDIINEVDNMEEVVSDTVG